jgi:hypothetical protein
MKDIDERFHAEWLGLVQPVDGLVVSIPVLVEAQCMAKQPPELQRRLAELCVPQDDGGLGLADLAGFVAEILGWPADALQPADDLPEEMSLFVPEGHQTLVPTAALRRAPGEPVTAEAPPLLLLWDLGPDAVGLSLDRPETVTGPWDYPAAAKFDRLLRHAQVPIGILSNRTALRLVYAPHGESSGSITFRLADMVTTGGRPILDALVMLLGADRLWSVAPERQLPALLAESRTRQANVTNELADQVKAALALLLRGFEAAAERDGRHLLEDAYRLGDDHLYGGLLTQLLRMVFVLYAEDRGLLPVEDPLYAENLSLLGLFDELQADHGAHPDSMSRRFGAYGRLVALIRALFLGVSHGDLKIPARKGELFSPHTYPFLEGWRGEPGSAPIVDPGARAEVRVPSVDDETVFRVLEKLLYLDQQRLSYRALDVEQIGSVYEALMGYKVERLPAPAVCLRPARVWVTARELLEQKPALRAKWIQAQTGLPKAQAEKVNRAVAGVVEEEEVLAALEAFAVKARRRGAGGVESRAEAGRYVIQPGPERRRTSSHYTPRGLTAPIVEKTLRPLLKAMGEEPASERILELKVCDPAMGSGAFLVEACRFLADEVVKAWTREGKRELVAGAEDVTLVARRLVAQRCLYGVDKNPFAVSLAKLSLWLVTLARDLPFTFLDHALRHGDSLVGLSFEQITSFHWKPGKQLDLCRSELTQILDEAIVARQKILELATDETTEAEQHKKWLLDDAQDAISRIRLIGDLIVGAFFAATKDKDREKERMRRLDLVTAWLQSGAPPPQELLDLQAEIRERIPVFHWMAEYPEVFWLKRPDPLDDDRTDGVAWIDAFVGNPPFLGGTRISVANGTEYRDWLAGRFGTSSLTDLSAYFFRATFELLGAKGTIGLIATNTISQADTRLSGLAWICLRGGVIYSAERNYAWPGDAAVSVSVVHVAKELRAPAPFLDGQPVQRITSFLQPRGRDEPPQVLTHNRNVSVIGSFVLGIGFVFDDANSDANPLSLMHSIVATDPRNAKRLASYIGGEDLTTDPKQSSNRYVIDFGDITEREAQQYPALFEIVAKRVRPARASVKQRDRREEWWRHATRSPLFRRYVAEHGRALALSQVTSHLTLAFIPQGVIPAHTCVVFLLHDFSGFSVLQSRIHEAWARFHASSLEQRLRYIPTDCFETFPFPKPDPRTVIPELEQAGQTLYEARSAYMLETQQGLTQTYNRLKDPACTDLPIQHLRALHEKLDRAVLSAYGWQDIPIPPYTTRQTPAPQLFEDTLIDRLFLLNAARTS